MLTQKAAVFAAIGSVMGQFEGKCEPSGEERTKIINIVTEGIMQKKVSFSDEAWTKYPTEPKVRGYVNGMLNNWLRKDVRLNGGTKYVPANPGSRTGQGDPEIKNLKLLAKTQTDPAKVQLIEERIEARKAELQAEKAKDVEVDFSALDPEFLEDLGIDTE